MKNENFCKIFIYSLLNFICFLLSIIFLTSVYNIKDQDYVINNYNYYDTKTEVCSQNTFNKHYSSICALFSFYVISSFIFIIVLLIIIKRDKMDKENLIDNTIDNINEINQSNNRNSQEVIIINGRNNNNIENDNSSYRCKNDLSVDINNNNNNNNNNNENNRNNGNENNINKYNLYNNEINVDDSNEEDIEHFKTLMNILLYTFLFCQLLYFIELIVLSFFHHKSKKISEEETACKDIIDNYIIKTYRDLLIVGYIFFFIFIIFYCFIFILQFGKSSKKKLLKIADKGYFECFSKCIENRCVDLANCFKTKSDEEIRQENAQTARDINTEILEKGKYINELEDYISKLKKLNSKYPTGDISDSELADLNLFRIVN